MGTVGRMSYTSRDSTTFRYGGRVGRALRVDIISGRGGRMGARQIQGRGSLGELSHLDFSFIHE